MTVHDQTKEVKMFFRNLNNKIKTNCAYKSAYKKKIYVGKVKKTKL